jgi:hypothetical protein
MVSRLEAVLSLPVKLLGFKGTGVAGEVQRVVMAGSGMLPKSSYVDNLVPVLTAMPRGGALVRCSAHEGSGLTHWRVHSLVGYWEVVETSKVGLVGGRRSLEACLERAPLPLSLSLSLSLSLTQAQKPQLPVTTGSDARSPNKSFCL